MGLRHLEQKLPKELDVNRLARVSEKAREFLVRLDAEFPYVHLGSSLAALDVINVVLRILRRDGVCRDYFILSIGHVAPALYAILVGESLLPEEVVLGINRPESKITTHADNPELPFIDATTGSLGQGLSMGVGLALGCRLKGCPDSNVFVLMGDGELNEGQVWEAAMSAVKYGLGNLIALVSYNGYQLDGPTSEVKPINFMSLFESIGWNVLYGDGHDYNEIIDLINRALALKETGRPTVVFFRTVRGRGVRLIENSRKQTLNPPPRPEYSMRDALGLTLARLGEEMPDLVVVTADVGESTRARYFAERFPERFFNVGISEQDLMGVAAGLAISGYTPVAIAYAMFLMRGWEQIRNTIGRMGLNVKVIGTHAGLSDFADGPSHQALEDIALMRSLSNVVVISPADAWDVERILPVAIAHKGPVYVRIGRDYSPPITADIDYKFRIGEIYELVDGDDIVIMGHGPVLYNAIKASYELRKMGIKAGVYNAPTIKPINEYAVRKLARRVGNILIVEEHSPRGGLGSTVSEIVSGIARVRVLGVNGYGHWGRSQEELERFFGLDEESIMSVVLEMLRS